MINLGRVRPGSTIYIPFETFASSTGAPITLTGLATSDIQVYKDGGTTQRASASGFTLLDTDGIDFDGITGIHGFSIDLADNTTADFWAAGSKYFVVVSTVTVDSQTMSFIAATFEIGYQGSWLDTTITYTNSTTYVLAAGPAEDDALNGHWAILHDQASAVQTSRVLISDYTGASKTVTLAAAATFTGATGDNISIMGMAPMQPATLGRQPVVDASGLVDANTVKVGPTGSGTAQTARDIGASVLLSSGTGTGQLDFTSGVVKSNVTQIGGSAVSTTTAQLGVNVVQVSGDSTAADNCESFFDGSGYGVHVARTTVASVTSQTILMLNTGTISLAVANAYKGCMVIIRDHTDTKNVMFAVCTAYDESTGQLTIDSTSGATFTIAASNIVEFVLPTYAQDDRANDATTATYIDTEVAAIKAKTDSLTFTVAGKVDANATHVSGSAVSTSSAQIGVNVVNFGGSAGTFASGIPAVNATQISGDSVAADNAESFFDGTGFGSHVLRTTVANVTNQTIFGLASASTGVANAYKGCMVAIRDHTTPANVMFAVCTAYDEGTGDLTINPTTGATFTIATSNIVEILLPTFAEDDRTTLASGTSAATIADAVWDEARTGHTTAGTFGRYLDAQISTISGGGGATADATYVDAAHTWTFPSAVQTTATRIINELIGFNGLACMDFTNVIPPEVAISSVDSAAFANISGTEPTVGTTSVSTNLKKVLIPVNATSATANTYTLSVTVTTTDSQQFTRKGQFTVA